MKTLQEISNTPHVHLVSVGEDGDSGTAQVYLWATKRGQGPVTVIFSRGGGWDHVSVSFHNRAPHWDEMKEVKEAFFYPDETVVQYHMPDDTFAHKMPNVLHLFRPRETEMPIPPIWMVGPGKGQTMAEARREAEEYLRARGE